MEYNAILSQIGKELECFIQTAVVDSASLSEGVSLRIKACLHRSDALGAENDVGGEAVLVSSSLTLQWLEAVSNKGGCVHLHGQQL
jgi:hypothetical protein